MKESTKRTIAIFDIIISLLPSVLLLQLPSIPTFRSIALWVSAVVGYMGIVMLLWMHALGAKSIMGMWFCDLAPVLSIHKWLGKYGTVLIFLHPIFITLSYGESWLYSFIPQLSTVAERHILLGQIALGILTLVWVTSALMRGKLSWRAWRYVHWLAYVSIPFALLHVPDLGSQEQAHILVKGYYAALVLAFCVISLLRLRSFLNLDRKQYEVTRIMRLTDLDYLLRLSPNSTALAPPRRGQYVYTKLGFISEDHPFSVTQYDETTGEITLGVRRSGMFTKQLEKLTEGSSVYLSGPYGSFTEDITERSDQPVVYLAGGIGITPFVDRIMRENGTREQWLFAANRTHDLAVLYQPLKKQLGDRAIAVYNTDDSELGPNEERGYITADLLRKYLTDPTKYRYYLCGPPAMMDAMRSVIISLGVVSANIRSEEFGW